MRDNQPIEWVARPWKDQGALSDVLEDVAQDRDAESLCHVLQDVFRFIGDPANLTEKLHFQGHHWRDVERGDGHGTQGALAKLGDFAGVQPDDGVSIKANHGSNARSSRDELTHPGRRQCKRAWERC